MKHLLLLGTFILVVLTVTQYRCLACGGNGGCHSCSASATCCGYDSCDSCCSNSCGSKRCSFSAGFNDPYAGMYYNGGCQTDCIGFKKVLYAPFRGLGALFGCGGNSCGGYGDYADCGETRGGCGYLYVGDYYNNPPGCEPCDGFGNMSCYQAGCPSFDNCNSCNTCSGGYSAGYASTPAPNYNYSVPQRAPSVPYAAPQQVVPTGVNPGCKNCGQGMTTHYSNNARPVSRPVAAPVSNTNQQQFSLQEKLIGGSGTQTYRSAPVQQATNSYQQHNYRR